MLRDHRNIDKVNGLMLICDLAFLCPVDVSLKISLEELLPWFLRFSSPMVFIHVTCGEIEALNWFTGLKVHLKIFGQ